jgi:virulence factor Mce-like protein
MILSRFVKTQLVIFTIASLVGLFVMAYKYMQLQEFLGIGRMTVTLEIPAAGGLYRFSNVTYNGVQVGKVTDVALTKTGVKATMSLGTSVNIPADAEVSVRSVSAVGEQYVDLRPRNDAPPFLHDGSVIHGTPASLPQPVGPMLDQLSALVGSIPTDKLHSLFNELFAGLGGADYDLQSLLDSSSKLVSDVNPSADRLRALVEDTSPLLDTQDQSADAIRTWTRSLVGVTGQLVHNDPQLRTLLDKGPGFARELTQLLDQIKPTVPVLLANLTTVGQLAFTYHPGLEQALVLLPPLLARLESIQPNRNASGLGLGSFLLSGTSDSPACTVGFLPPSSWRTPSDTTTIDTPDDVYCKLPQDSPIGVRGVRNIPCMGKPGKRAPTAEICNSDQDYEPISQRQPVIGPYPRDPRLESQGIPPDSRWFPDQGLYAPVGVGPPVPAGPPPGPPPSSVPPLTKPSQSGVSSDVPPVSAGLPPFANPSGPLPGPAAAPAPPADGSATAAPSAFNATNQPLVGFAEYNPRTGEYVAPDGKLYRQSDLVTPSASRTWQDLVFIQ